jgi:deoxyribose-phosphate aldolase
MALEMQEIAKMIDHTLLKPDATSAQIERLCEEARRYGFASVCVNPVHVHACAEKLEGEGMPKVCTVIGFPLGASASSVKSYETQVALTDGADEIDMVINIGALKDGNLALVGEDIRGVVDVAHAADALVKVIIETVLLSDAEKETACLLAKDAGADFVKTSTGFAGGGATVADVKLMRRVVGEKMGVKASGGVRSLADALAMIEAGATRLGASAGVKIVQGLQDEGKSDY